MNFSKIGIILSAVYFFLSLNSSALAVDRAPIPGISTADLTIFRTVNTLSCHPQNPLLHEIPHYVMFAPNKDYGDGNGVKGSCWAYHNEGTTNFLTIGIGKPALRDSEDFVNGVKRPLSPLHHYSVFEFPNPDYDPTKEADCRAGRLTGKEAFCGKYVHWEGYGRMMQLAISSHWVESETSAGAHEVWYQKNHGGHHEILGKNVGSVEKAGTVTKNGRTYTVYAGKLTKSNLNSITWKSCSWPEVDYPDRLGDEDRPCFDREISMDTLKEEYGVYPDVYANPMIFPDIQPRNRATRNPRYIAPSEGDGVTRAAGEWYDDAQDPTDDNDDMWITAACRNKYPGLFGQSYDNYIQAFRKYLADIYNERATSAANARVAPVAPAECDFPSLISQFPDGNVGPKPTSPAQLAMLLNSWNTLGSTPITPGVPTFTPTPTMSHGRSDLNGDGAVNVQDYNIFVTDFGKTAAGLRGDINKDGKVDVQDYNFWVSDFVGGH
jgi:hypothetical protein